VGRNDERPGRLRAPTSREGRALKTGVPSRFGCDGPPGSVTQPEIDENLNYANVVLMLVSADFIALQD
jgi:hypothetical protein